MARSSPLCLQQRWARSPLWLEATTGRAASVEASHLVAVVVRRPTSRGATMGSALPADATCSEPEVASLAPVEAVHAGADSEAFSRGDGPVGLPDWRQVQEQTVLPAARAVEDEPCGSGCPVDGEGASAGQAFGHEIGIGNRADQTPSPWRQPHGPPAGRAQEAHAWPRKGAVSPAPSSPAAGSQ